MLECDADKVATSAANAQVSRKLSNAATKGGLYNIFSPEPIDDLKVPECWNCLVWIRQSNFACEIGNF